MKTFALASLFHFILAQNLAGAVQESEKILEPSQQIHLKTSDEVEVVADFYAPKQSATGKSPAAILIHMYPANRKSWRPLVPKLRKACFAVLCYDIRGQGESVRPKEQNLKSRYGRRDPKLFAGAWRDTEAAVKWLAKQKIVDSRRVVLIGASVGCSISLDYAASNKDIRAVVCLSPGTNYMGLNSIEHIRKLGRRPVLLIAPQAERAAVLKLAEVARNATMEIHPGSSRLHGTGMFAAPYGKNLSNRIVEFVKKGAKQSEQIS